MKRQNSEVNRLFDGVNRFQPLFEFGGAGLGNDDPLGGFDRKVQRKATPEPHGNLLHGAARNDELAVGSEKLSLGQQSLQRLESLSSGSRAVVARRP